MRGPHMNRKYRKPNLALMEKVLFVSKPRLQAGTGKDSKQASLNKCSHAESWDLMEWRFWKEEQKSLDNAPWWDNQEIIQMLRSTASLWSFLHEAQAGNTLEQSLSPTPSPHLVLMLPCSSIRRCHKSVQAAEELTEIFKDSSTSHLETNSVAEQWRFLK